jgi:hypothetical protein
MVGRSDGDYLLLIFFATEPGGGSPHVRGRSKYL